VQGITTKLEEEVMKKTVESQNVDKENEFIQAQVDTLKSVS
jgi:hypothetical protein